MKSIVKNLRLLVAALVIGAAVVTGVTSCTPPAVTNPTLAPEIQACVGTWVNDDGGWHSEYVISEEFVKDLSMNCEFKIASKKSVTSKDGCTLIFTECTKGTTYTPAGNFYIVAVKMADGKLSISCPIDYSSTYTTLVALQEKYTADYDVAGNSNYFTVCTKK